MDLFSKFKPVVRLEILCVVFCSARQIWIISCRFLHCLKVLVYGWIFYKRWFLFFFVKWQVSELLIIWCSNVKRSTCKLMDKQKKKNLFQDRSFKRKFKKCGFSKLHLWQFSKIHIFLILIYMFGFTNS